MALIPTRWTNEELEFAGETEPLTEGATRYTIETGLYVTSDAREKEIMLQCAKTHLNTYGVIVKRVEEKWRYEDPDGPPLEYERLVFSSGWLPGYNEGTNRAARLVERHRATYLAFTPYTDRDNLACVAYTDGIVISDGTIESAALSDNAAMIMAMRGFKADVGTVYNRVVHTQRWWEEAVGQQRVVDEVDSFQRADWMNRVKVSQDVVKESWWGWTIWTAEKDALKAGHLEWKGPRYIRKTGVRFECPIPLQPPTITASPTSRGVRIEIRGGGGEFPSSWPALVGGVRIFPQGYRIYRQLIELPTVEGEDPDPLGVWEDGEEPEPEGAFVRGNLEPDDGGGPSTQTEEPHDPSEVADDELDCIGEVKNAALPPDEPHASYFDLGTIQPVVYSSSRGRSAMTQIVVEVPNPEEAGLVSGATYAYTASCFIESSESDLANGVTVQTLPGSGYESSRSGLGQDYGADVDINVPADLVSREGGELPGSDQPFSEWGLPIEGTDVGAGGYPATAEIPTDAITEEDGIDTLLELAQEIAVRQFAQRGDSPEYAVVVKALLYAFRRHDRLQVPTVAWRAHFPGRYQAESEAGGAIMRLRGWQVRFGVSEDRQLIHPETILRGVKL